MSSTNGPATSVTNDGYTPEALPTSVDYLLIGAGLASATAAETLRARDPEASILIVGADPERPYHRPPLSKEYLRGAIEAAGVYGSGGVYVYEPAWYATHHVMGVANMEVVALDASAKTARLADGHTISYGKALLATGARPRHLTIAGADLPGVYVLRTLADSTALRDALARGGSRVVILGSGFIGLEAACQALYHSGKVTIIEPMTRLWERLFPPAISEYFEEQYTRRQAATYYGYAPLELRAGQDGRVGSVVFRAVDDPNSRPETIPADIVLMAVGVNLNTELAAAAGLRVDPRQGVIVDDHLRTSAPDIYAAGDIAAYPDPIVGTTHVEHWENAIESAKVAAENMSGGDVAYAHVPYFFSDQFDLSINVLGYPAPDAEMALRGDPERDEFTAFFVRDGRLIGALMVNDDAQMDTIKALIAAATPIADVGQLADPQFDLASLARPDTPGTPPQP